MSIRCFLNGHKLKHIVNFNDIPGGRALWQCERCKLVHIDLPLEFYLKLYHEGKIKRMGPNI